VKIHKRLILLVGLGMLLIMTITVMSLQNMTTFFSNTTSEIGLITLEVQRSWTMERKVDTMTRALRSYVRTGDSRYHGSFDAARGEVQKIIDELARPSLIGYRPGTVDSMTADFRQLVNKADRIFSLGRPADRDQVLAQNLLMEIDDLRVWMDKDIDQYKKRSAELLSTLAEQLGNNELRINFLLLALLFTSAGFLVGFSIYLFRNVSLPLADLWEGTEAISSGNLDYQMKLQGESDIVRLGKRFNEMAQKLRASHDDLERKLLGRTRELAALDAVALTLGQSASLKDVLQKSLDQIMGSLVGMKPIGGIFLCDSDGEHLRLVTHRGLSPEFVQQEGTIRMGECLCGVVAQTGEMLFTPQGCVDPRHTHGSTDEGHAHVIIPIKSRGVVLGVIFLYPEKEFTLQPSDVQLLDSIGAQLGMAVENFRFYGEVKESSEKYWDLFENSRDVLFTLDRAGVLTAVNNATEQFLGRPKIELIGSNIIEYLTPEGAAIAKTGLAGENVEARNLAEVEIVRKDGSRAFLDVNVRQLFKNRRLTGFQISARDATTQKSLREMLVEAERLTAILELGIAIRHEINNPLTTIIGNAELLLERFENTREDAVIKRLDVILSNALRIAEIVKKLQRVKKDKVVEYLKGVKMTDLKQGPGEGT